MTLRCIGDSRKERIRDIHFFSFYCNAFKLPSIYKCFLTKVNDIFDFIDITKYKRGKVAAVFKSEKYPEYLISKMYKQNLVSYLANTLLLSMIWHILRVVFAHPKWIKNIKSIVSQFFLPFWSRSSFSVLCLPRKHGGLGLIDIDSSISHFI